MNEIPVCDVRNFAFMGHTGSGKTSLTDAILFKLGLNDRQGSVDQGSSMADYGDEEKSRKITIFAKPFTGAYTSGGKRFGMVFTDTPGYLDFHGQVISSCRAVEAAVITVNAAAGVQVGTQSVWRRCEKSGIARAIAITGLDRDNTDFNKTLDDIRSKFGNTCVPVVLPLPDKTGVVDVLGGGKDVPAAMASQINAAKTALSELAAETDDALIEKFLGGEELTAEELAGGLRKAVRTGRLIPVFACMPMKNIGVTQLLDGAARLFPAPTERTYLDNDGKPIGTTEKDPFVGFVWRTVNDPFVGQISFVRIIGGILHADSEIQNSSKDQKERVGGLLIINGKKQGNTTEARPGDIVALAKLKGTGAGDTVCAVGTRVICPRITFPSPVVFMAVTAKTQADEDKMGVALARVAEEDPTLRVSRNTETKEIVLAGLGDVHIDVAVGLMKNRSNVEVVLSTPKVPYRETVTTRGEGHYKHKKQSGGRGQYGEVYLRVEPRQATDEEWFEDAIVGGVIPGNFIPAIQKGLVDAMQAGAVAGFPVMNVKATVYDGSYHDVDSSEISFKIAGSRAFKDGMSKAKPVLLEPIMTVKVMVPDTHMGDITGDLNHRRGRILGIGTEDGGQVITADVPQAELFRYAAELRSMTAGQGAFEMEFSRYEIVPSNVAQKVVASAGKKKDEEED